MYGTGDEETRDSEIRGPPSQRRIDDVMNVLGCDGLLLIILRAGRFHVFVCLHVIWGPLSLMMKDWRM